MSIQYTSTVSPFVHNEKIYEWDIKSANTSLLRYYSLLDEEKIKYIESKPKSERTYLVGKICQRDKELTINLEKAFTDIMEEFIEANNINRYDIISIKKDAIFLKNIDPEIVSFGDKTVKFIKKNTYHSCILIPRYEFYINDDKIDVKGVNDNKLSDHERGMLEFINDIIDLYKDKEEFHKYFKEFVTAYKRRELNHECYMEFNSESKYTINIMGNEVIVDHIDDELLKMTHISHNYENIILPILKIVDF